MLIAVNYHYVRPAFDAPYAGIHGVIPQHFARQLQTLAQAGQFVSGADILAAARGDRALPERALVVTFDDGLQEQFVHAWPELRRLGIPAIFFVNTHPIVTATVSAVHQIHLLRASISPEDFLSLLERWARQLDLALPDAPCNADAERHYKYDSPAAARLKYLLNFQLPPATRDRLIAAMFDEIHKTDAPALSRELYLRPEQVHRLAGDAAVGSHGHEHLPLGLLEPSAIDFQVRQASEHIAAWTGTRPVAFSYPYGSAEASSPAVAATAASQGIAFAFTMERAANVDLEQPLHLARFDNNDLPGGKACRWSVDELFDRVPRRRWFR